MVATTAFVAAVRAATRLQSAVRGWRVAGFAAAAFDARALLIGDLSSESASLGRRMQVRKAMLGSGFPTAHTSYPSPSPPLPPVPSLPDP